MSVKVIYTTKARAFGGRTGRAETLDGAFSVNLSTPKELGGSGGDGNNPEQLFASGYSACFLGAIRAVAGKEPKAVISDDASVTATVGFGPREAGGFGLTVALEVSLPGLDQATAEALVDKAHQVCPYSNATRNNIAVQLTVV